MEFLGVGPLEFFFILLIALIIIGPRDMAKTARTLGRSLNRLYKSESWRMILQASRNLRTLPNRLAREAELSELREAREALKEAGQEISRDTRSLKDDLKAWTTPPSATEEPEAPASPKSTSDP
ncbi:MAG TPA: twin-arginine translocase TatA/TatE family subunit [Anaerolineales bacterium]|nr:twin-arginine translocase TatA/TatE family subunit [Anaerolineales bacterium]